MPPERLDDIWVNNDYPVLLEVVRRATDTATQATFPKHIAEALPTHSPQDVQAGLSRLAQYGYIKAEISFPDQVTRILGVTERAIRTTGAWPSSDPTFEDLVAFLDQQIEAAPPEEKPKRRRIRDAIVDAGTELGVKVFVELAARQAGF